MNRYVVTIDRRNHTVEACNSRVAINRAMRGFEQRQTVTVDCTLQEKKHRARAARKTLARPGLAYFDRDSCYEFE